MKKIIVLFFVLSIFFTSCAEKTVDLPMPEELFSTIETTVDLPDMVDVSEDFLESNLGISNDSYDSAVYYIMAMGASCEEIIIVRAKDDTSASDIYEKLETWLSYVEKSAHNYLTEYLPMISNAMLRRDGLTVSLVISDHVSQIESIFDSFAK